MSAASNISDLIEPIVRSLGLELDDVRITKVGRRSIVKVVVDGEDGVTLDRIADVSRAAGAAIDEAAAMGSADWTLEVSSPGIDRPLTLPRHWRRAIGRLVQVRLADGAEFDGRVVEVDAEGDEITVDVAGSERRLDRSSIARALVQVEFNRSIRDEDLEPIGDEE